MAKSIRGQEIRRELFEKMVEGRGPDGEAL